ncbi:MAG: signal peptide peptidase SppA [bacterium]
MKFRVVALVLFLLLVVVMAVVTILVAGAILVFQGDTPFFFGGEKVALVRIEGLLYDVDEWLDQIDDYAKDSSIKAVVIRIDSPGGAISPSQDLHRAICDLREKHNKVVVASFGSLAASGGYYAGCGADTIIASAGTITGSIGVYLKFWQAQSLLEKIGVGTETVKAGVFKDIGDLDRGLTEEERGMLQETVDDMYDQFVEAVQTGRRNRMLKLLRSDPAEIRSAKSGEEGEIEYPFSDTILALIEEYNQAIPVDLPDTVKGATETLSGEIASASRQEEATGSAVALSSATSSVSSDASPKPSTDMRCAPLTVENRLLKLLVRHVADGKIYTGRQALDIGLVDQLGTLDDSIKVAAKLAGFEGKPRVVEKKRGRPSLLDILTRGLAKVTSSKIYPPIEYRLLF